MNYEMFIPFYGNYIQMQRMTTPEATERPFVIQAADAISAGAVSGTILGISFNVFPTLGGVTFARAALPAAKVALPLSIPAALAVANFMLIESMPEHQQRGAWQMFASAIGGTFGGDYSGLVN